VEVQGQQKRSEAMPTETTTKSGEEEKINKDYKDAEEDSLFSSYLLDFSPFTAHAHHITSLPPAPMYIDTVQYHKNQ
jgi:hypothetical protein